MSYKDYTLLEDKIVYVCPDTGRTLTCEFGMKSDGATFARDISGPVRCQRGIQIIHKSASWWYHDLACERGTWDNGDTISNWEASHVLRRTLWSEGRYFISPLWFTGTFLFGGNKLSKF